VLPYFRCADAHEGGDPQYRSSDVPLHNRYGRLDNRLQHPQLQAAQQAGYPTTPDCNGFQRVCARAACCSRTGVPWGVVFRGAEALRRGPDDRHR
jgi:hypothetical protein